MGHLLISTAQFLNHKYFGSSSPTDMTFATAALTVLVLLLFVEDAYTYPIPIIAYTFPCPFMYRMRVQQVPRHVEASSFSVCFKYQWKGGCCLQIHHFML